MVLHIFLRKFQDLVAVNNLKGPFTLRMITINTTIMITILVSVPELVISHFKCSTSIKWDGF